MTRIRTIRIIRRMACALAGLAAAVLASAATFPAAFAMEVPPQPVANLKHPPVPVHTHAAVAIGMAGWQITLIVIGAAVLAAALAVTADRILAALRRVSAPAA